MKNLRFLLLPAIAIALLTGCGSVQTVRSTVKERFASQAPRKRSFEGNQRQIYDAAKITMEKLGYQMAAGGPAQGRLEGFSKVGSGDDFRSSRQRSVELRMEPMDGGLVEVQLLLREIIEEDFARGGAPTTESAVRDPGSYEAFFNELGRQLLIVKAAK